MNRRTFLSPYENLGDYSTKDYNGKICTVLGLADESTYDREEVGDMYRVRFDDGVEVTAWPEELGYGACLDGNELWPHPNLSDEDIEPDSPFSTWEEWAQLTREGKL